MPEQHENAGDDWSGAVARALEQVHADTEEDTPPLDILSASGLVPSGEKVPLEEAANLILAREAAEGIRRDEISAEEYLEKVKQVALVAENGIKLFSAEVVKAETAKLPPQQIELVEAFEQQVYVLKEGTDLMIAFLETGDIDDLDRGLALVEESMRAVDAIQDRALEMAATEEASGASETAEGEDEEEEEEEEEGVLEA